MPKTHSLRQLDRIIRELTQLITDEESFNDNRHDCAPVDIEADRVALSLLKKIRRMTANNERVPDELFDGLFAALRGE